MRHHVLRSTLTVVAFSLLSAGGTLRGDDTNTAGKWAFYESEALDVYYPLARRVYLEGIGITRLCKEAMADLEKQHGAFGTKVVVTVYDRDSLNADPKADLVPGYTREIETKDENLPPKIVNVVLTIWGVNEEVLRHEFLHAFLLSNGIVPPRWLNEGLAYYYQRQDGFNQRWFELLSETPPLPLKELPMSVETAEDDSVERRRQASGWLLVYYLRKIEGKSLKQVLEMARDSKLPEPSDLLGSVQRYRDFLDAEQRASEERLQLRLADFKLR